MPIARLRTRRMLVPAIVAGLLSTIATGVAVADHDRDAAGVAPAVAAQCEPNVGAVPEAGPRACGGLDRFAWLTAQHCRRSVVAAPAAASACDAVDGRRAGEEAMAAYEASWTARALDLQRDLDRTVPLLHGLTIHTHNSGNAAAYAPSLTINDANQIVSVTDQLRLGVRGIEIDLHWAPHPDGDPAEGGRAVVQCHGQSEGSGNESVHPGCSIDRLFDAHAEELASWLATDAAEDEIVILYLENQLSGSEAAHRSAVASLQRHLGEDIFRPTTGGGCQDLPVHLREQEILDAGARVLVTGNCGSGGWNDWVFARGAAWSESGGTSDYTCEDDRARTDYDARFVRRYEDSTFLSLMANGGSHITEAIAADMVRCGVNFPGLDQTHPGDDRLAAFVWSWRVGDRGDDPALACASFGADARIGSTDCSTMLPAACRTADGGWALSAEPVPWGDRDLGCDRHAGTPFNGADAAALAAVADGETVWLGYGRDAAGRWHART